MVGHIQQRTAPFRVLLQPGNELVEELVDIHNAVVISIDQLFVAATVDFFCVARRCEAAFFVSIALKIGRAVVADGVQHNHRIFLDVLQQLVQFGQHNVVQTLAVGAVFGQVQLHHIRHAADILAHAFAIAVVFQPVNVRPGGLQDVQQVVLPFGADFVIRFARQAGEHAGHGKRCGRAATLHVREIHQGIAFGHPFGQLGRGLVRVAVQAPVFRARGFAHHQNGHVRFGSGMRQLRALPQRQIRHVFTAYLFDFAGHRANRIAGQNHVFQAVVVAEKRSVILIKQRGNQQNHQHRSQHGGKAGQQFFPPCAVLDFGAQIQKYRHDAEEKQPGNVRWAEHAHGFGRRGLQHVVQHIAVEIHIKKQAVIADGHTDEQDNRHQDFVCQRQHQQMKQQVAGAQQEQRHGIDKIIVKSADGLIELEDFQDNRKIEHEGEQSSLQEHHPVGRCLKTG